MAKKILSILCALAMMVTMVSVAAFSASAAPEGYADFDGLADMTLTVDTDGNYGNNSGWYAKVGSGRYESAYFGSTALLADQALLSVSSDEYAIDGEFSITYYLQRMQYDGGNGTQRDGSVAYGFLNKMVLGDLEVMFTSNNSPSITCDVSYNGQLLNSVQNSWGYWTGISAGSADHTAILDDMRGAFAQGSYASTGDRILIEVKVAYSNGNVTVSFGQPSNTSKQSTVTAAISDADFSAAALTLTLAEKHNKGSHLYGFSGTYKTVSTGGEGGETPDPEEPSGDVNFNLLDSKNITGWTLTRASSGGNKNYSGNIDLTSLKLNGITGTLVQTQANSSSATWVNFDYNNGVSAIDFGDNFSILMTAYISTNLATSIPPKDTYVSLKLGDYSVRLVHFVEDAATETVWNQRDSFRIAVYSGNTLIAVSDVIDRSVTTSLYNGAVISSNTNAWKKDGTYGGYIKSKSEAADKSTAKGGVNFAGDNSWKDIEIVVNDNKMTIKTVAGVCGLHVLSGSDSADDVTTLSGFNTTALDLPSGTSFDGIVPQVVLDVDGDLRKNQAVGVFRLEGTIYAPEDSGESTEPLAPTGVYPTLNSDLTLNVIYANAADYKDTVKVTATVEGMSPKTVALTEKDGYLVASFDFLTPDKFGSEITLNAVDTNGIAESYSTTYSVKQYCKNMMDKDSSSAELKALCMALLQFGDSYAVYKNGSTFLSDMSSYVTAYAPTAWTQGTAAWTYTGTANGAEWVGANLNFAGEIGINVNFKADGDASDYTVDASFGTVSDVIVDGDTFMATIRISSSFLSNQNEVAVKSAEGVISEVFTLSVEDWVNANIGKMEDAKTKAFVIALMTYGDAAAAYRN